MDYKIFFIRTLSSFFIVLIFLSVIFINSDLIAYIFLSIYIIIFYEIYKNFLFYKKIYFLYLYVIVSLFLIQIYLYLYFQLEHFIIYCAIIVLFDTICYVFGSLFGKKKILPNISPNKTYFGFISGFVCTFLIMFYLIKYLEIFSELYSSIFIILIIIFSFGGDLIESYFKRISNIKNSSNLIPGHGGFFDRFDSFILGNYGLFIFFYLKEVL